MKLKYLFLLFALGSFILVYGQPNLSISKSTYYANEVILLVFDSIYENVTVFYMPRDFQGWLIYGTYNNVSNVSISLAPGDYAIKASLNGQDSNVVYVSVVVFTLYDLFYLIIFAILMILTLFRGPLWAVIAIGELLIIFSWNAFGQAEQIYFWLFAITLACGAYSFFKFIREMM